MFSWAKKHLQFSPRAFWRFQTLSFNNTFYTILNPSFIVDSSSAMVATASAASEVKVASTVVTALPSLLPNEDDYRGTTTTTATTSPKKISASAQNIIDSFPLLDFMQSTVLTKLWHHHWRNWKYIRTHCLMSTTHCSKTSPFSGLGPLDKCFQKVPWK